MSAAGVMIPRKRKPPGPPPGPPPVLSDSEDEGEHLAEGICKYLSSNTFNLLLKLKLLMGRDGSFEL